MISPQQHQGTHCFTKPPLILVALLYSNRKLFKCQVNTDVAPALISCPCECYSSLRLVTHLITGLCANSNRLSGRELWGN